MSLPLRKISIKSFEHQIAGHTNENVRKFGEHCIIKPQNKPDLFKREVYFYEECVKKERVVHKFIPRYFGVVEVEDEHTTDRNIPSDTLLSNCARVPPLRPCLILEDYTLDYLQPSLIDIKIGRQTYEPTALQDKIKRELIKYPYQSEIGFRITGFKVYNEVTGKYDTVSKWFGRSLLPEEVIYGLAYYFYNGMNFRLDILRDMQRKLLDIQQWIEVQTRYKFFCSSILMVYDSQQQQQQQQPALLGKEELVDRMGVKEGSKLVSKSPNAKRGVRKVSKEGEVTSLIIKQQQDGGEDHEEEGGDEDETVKEHEIMGVASANGNSQQQRHHQHRLQPLSATLASITADIGEGEEEFILEEHDDGEDGELLQQPMEEQDLAGHQLKQQPQPPLIIIEDDIATIDEFTPFSASSGGNRVMTKMTSTGLLTNDRRANRLEEVEEDEVPLSRVGMIDFAHTCINHLQIEEIDEGYLHGVKNLIHYLQEIEEIALLGVSLQQQQDLQAVVVEARRRQLGDEKGIIGSSIIVDKKVVASSKQPIGIESSVGSTATAAMLMVVEDEIMECGSESEESSFDGGFSKHQHHHNHHHPHPHLQQTQHTIFMSTSSTATATDITDDNNSRMKYLHFIQQMQTVFHKYEYATKPNPVIGVGAAKLG